MVRKSGQGVEKVEMNRGDAGGILDTGGRRDICSAVEPRFRPHYKKRFLATVESTRIFDRRLSVFQK